MKHAQWHVSNREGHESFARMVGDGVAVGRVARRRARWKAHQIKLDPSRLVFIDETWAKTNMAKLRGWGMRGQRRKGLAPHGHWRTMTLLAGLRGDAIVAPFIVDGPINGDWFRLYVEQVLVPTLRPGDIVIMDNLGSHKGQAVRRLIRAAGVAREPSL